METGTWYMYDDSSVKEIPEGKVKSSNAYILFYQRKDLMQRKLEEI